MSLSHCPANKRLLLLCSLSMLCALYILVADAHAQSGNVPPEQLAIQKLIDDVTLSDEEFLGVLKNHSEIGEKLIAFYDYLEFLHASPNTDFEDSAKLENNINYHFTEYFMGRQRDKNERKIVQLNKRYEIFEEGDLLLNLLNYTRTYQDRPKFDNDLLIGSHLKNLRYLNLYTNKLAEYGAWLREVKGYLFKRELSFWEDRLAKQICDQSHIRKDCVQKILNNIPDRHEVDPDNIGELLVLALCRVNIILNRKLYRFDFCEKRI
ncbi:MAG: hypothetical protein AAF724_04990 [Pseudomonadota bacterium]